MDSHPNEKLEIEMTKRRLAKYTKDLEAMKFIPCEASVVDMSMITFANISSLNNYQLKYVNMENLQTIVDNMTEKQLKGDLGEAAEDALTRAQSLYSYIMIELARRREKEEIDEEIEELERIEELESEQKRQRIE